MPFERSNKKPSGRPDRKGLVLIKIGLVKEVTKSSGERTLESEWNNRKEELVIEEASVGEVFEVVEKALFGNQAEG